MSTFPECAAAMFVAGIDCEEERRRLLQAVDSNATPSDTTKIKIKDFTDAKVIEDAERWPSAAARDQHPS
jgi:hypothetical protein